MIKFTHSTLWCSKYISFDVGRLTFGTGYFLRNFTLGVQITGYTITLNLGFLWFDVDWYDKDVSDWYWEDDNEDEDLSGKP